MISMKKPDVRGNDDTMAWFTELERHHMGEFSMAAYQANSIMEDYSQVEVGDNSLFIGIYDGHNGTNAAKFISNYIFQELQRLICENNNVMNGKFLREAVAATEQKFIDVVIDSEKTNPDIPYVGSCCLIALIWEGTLYAANLGDSRAVDGETHTDHPCALTGDHHCEDRHNRTNLLVDFPDDPTILLKDENGWKVKGLSKVIGTIGDIYIKRSLTYSPSRPVLTSRRLTYSPSHPVLTSRPETNSFPLRYFHEFFILASRGFWEIMTNMEAVSIVRRHPRRDIAKTLLRKALEKVAAKQRMSYKDIALSPNRKKYHDDITIIVVFLDHDKSLRKRNVPKLSYKAPLPL